MTDEELWAAVVGQDEAVALLRAAVASPVHAYLLVGPPGAGRADAARAFAGALLSDGTEADDADRHRRLAIAGRHPDLVWIAPGGRALLVEEAEGITVEASRSPIESDRKVVVVDRFDTAEPESAASLLKTIEEPPASAVFVLLADEVAATGDSLPVDVVAYGTEAGLFQAAGIPAVLWGPGDISVAHRPDEFVEVADLEVCLALLARLGGHFVR